MVTPRPVDALDHTKLGMQKQRADAISEGVCLKCCRKPEFRNDAEAREFVISGLCDDCFTAIWADEEDEE